MPNCQEQFWSSHELESEQQKPRRETSRRALMEKLNKMYDAKKWPVDIRASGFLKTPDFIPGDLKNSISITDLDQVVLWP